MASGHQTPPRNGEGDRASEPKAQAGGGGVLAASSNAHAVATRERRSGNLPEVLVWRELRKRPGGYKFRRQHPLSEVVLDFVCLSARVVIEVDGEAHNRGDRPERDIRREAWLRSQGFTVVRLPAAYVLNDLESAIETIVAACDAATPPPPLRGGPPPRAGEVFEGRDENIPPRNGEGDRAAQQRGGGVA